MAGSPYPVKVYTDHVALLSILRGDGTKGSRASHHKGRISSWMLRMSEYNVEYNHVKGKENRIADGLSRMSRAVMDRTRGKYDDWEDVAAIELANGGSEEELESYSDRNSEEDWGGWLKDNWYGDIIWYKLSSQLLAKGWSDKEMRRIKRNAVKYVLLIGGRKQGGAMTVEERQKCSSGLLYREVTGELARCIRRSEVDNILVKYHDSHGHFAKDMMLRMLRGRYFWPSRSKDVAYYCKSCDSCQRFGPLRPTPRSLRTILSLQPIDMMGIDYVGPINPASRSGNRYIIIAVDYFSRFLFARVTEKANGETTTRFMRQIAGTMGWPNSVYCDNASYFMHGVFPAELKAQKVLLFPAPITHPSSVGLAEKYMHLTMTALRTLLRGERVGEELRLDQ